MKKKLFFSLFLLVSNSFAYELEFNKSFNKSIKNDVVQSKISIIVDSLELDYINDNIESFQKIIDKEKKVTISDGNFSQIPIYKYENKKRIFSGYKGTLSYLAESSDYKTLDKFLSNLLKEQKKINSNQVKLSITNTQWIVSKKSYNQNIDKMRIESISWIKEYKKNLLDKCSVQNIAINKSSNFNPRYYKTNLSMERDSRQIAPIQSDQNISLSVNYKLDCK